MANTCPIVESPVWGVASGGGWERESGFSKEPVVQTTNPESKHCLHFSEHQLDWELISNVTCSIAHPTQRSIQPNSKDLVASQLQRNLVCFEIIIYSASHRIWIFEERKITVTTKKPVGQKGQIRSQKVAMLTKKTALSTFHLPSCTLHMRGSCSWGNGPLFFQSFHLLPLLPLTLHLGSLYAFWGKIYLLFKICLLLFSIWFLAETYKLTNIMSQQVTT